VYGGVERRSVTSGSQNPDAFHGCPPTPAANDQSSAKSNVA
jgi:hypothetical protein